MIVHFLALLILATLSQTLGQDAKTEPSSFIRVKKLIVGGQDAPEGSRPFQVSLGTGSGDEHVHFCGGAIIDEKWVLTVAQCTETYPKNKFRVKAGTNTLSSGGTLHDVEKVISHEDYEPRNLSSADIGLVQIKDTFKFNDKVKAIPLPKNNIQGGYGCIVSGWGYIDRGRNTLPDKLQSLLVFSLENHECRVYKIGRLPERDIADYQICSLSKAGKGFCQRDEGGPLTCDGVFTGLVSHNMKCARGLPEVYTRVYSFLDWISKNMK